MLTRGIKYQRREDATSPSARMLAEMEEDDEVARTTDGITENGQHGRDDAGGLSPSLYMEGMTAMFGHEDGMLSPCQFASNWEEEKTETTRRVTRALSDLGTQMYRAKTKRSSRTARPCHPEEDVLKECEVAIKEAEEELNRRGFVCLDVQEASQSVRARGGGSSGKGPGVKTWESDQACMNHMLSIKGKDVEQQNTEAYFLMGGNVAKMMYGRLAKASIRTNAVQSAVTERSKTQGAANQTSRINCIPVDQAASAQVVSCELTFALAREKLRARKHTVCDPMATNETNAASVVLVWETSDFKEKSGFVCSSTAKLVFNAVPAKLGAGSVMKAAKELAQKELDDYYISEKMGYSNDQLTGICRAITQPGEYDQDAVWSSWFLIVYLMSDPRGRLQVLSRLPLTDVDYHIAVAMESYGRAELTRRARLRKQRSAGDRRDEEDASVAGRAAAEVDAEDNKVIATKRRRSGKGQASASTSDANGLLEWWYRALRNSDRSVLLTLVAHTRSAARSAADATLERQAGVATSVSTNRVIRHIAENAAVRSAEALVPFVGRRVDEIPAIRNMSVVCRESDGRVEYKKAVGFTRVFEQQRSTLLLACRVSPEIQPNRSANMVLVHVHATTKLKPSLNDASRQCPNVLERFSHLKWLKEGAPGSNMSELRRSHQKEIHKTWILGETARPGSNDVTGLTRSVISLKMQMMVCSRHVEAADALIKEHSQMPTLMETGASSVLIPAASVISESQDASLRIEPYCSGNAPLVCGIMMNETLRTWMYGKTRKNDSCKLGVTPASLEDQTNREYPLICDTEPLPMLTITDFKLESIPNAPSTPVEGCSNFVSKQFCAALHVCGDGIVRVPEVVRKLDARCDVLLVRALVWVSVSQSSFVGDVGSVLCAGYANAAIESSKKMSIADVNRAANLSVFDCYVSGLMNIHPDFLGSAWAGQYGCRLDTGISPPGLKGHNLRSDKRQHGNMMLRKEPSNELARAFAKAHWIEFPEKKSYDAIPGKCRGVPHNLTPGVHSNLDDYVKALERTRELVGREDEDTVDSVMCLPFSAFSQSLPPDVEATADQSQRLCVREAPRLSSITGRAYLPDSTEEADALLLEPLWRRPCQSSVQDNPFATAYENGSSFWNAACALALLCEKVPLHQILCAWHRQLETGDESAEELTAEACVYAADAMILLSTMYPVNWAIDKECIPEAYAKAAPAVLRAYREKNERAPSKLCLRGLGLSEDNVLEARKYWSAFERGVCRRRSGLASDGTCAWEDAVEPLLRQILKWDGSHGIGLSEKSVMRDCFDKAARGAWLVHSADGYSPPRPDCPAASVDGPLRVRRPQMDPIFVGENARGCLVGLKPHQIRQVAALQLGAHLEGVEVQVVRNEGGLSLRLL